MLLKLKHLCSERAHGKFARELKRSDENADLLAFLIDTNDWRLQGPTYVHEPLDDYNDGAVTLSPAVGKKPCSQLPSRRGRQKPKRWLAEWLAAPEQPNYAPTTRDNT